MNLDLSFPWIGLVSLNLAALVFLAAAELVGLRNRRKQPAGDATALDPLIRLVERQEQETAATACRRNGEVLPPAAFGMQRGGR